MTLAKIRERNASYATRADGEEIGYRSHGSFQARRVNARVGRNPIGPVGEVLAKSVEVYISKVDVAAVVLGKDEVFIYEDQQPGLAVPMYKVVEVMEGKGPNAGRWLLRCTK